MREEFIDCAGKPNWIDFAEIETMTKEGRRIALIKEFRRVSGQGLKDSKDAIEQAIDYGSVADPTMKFPKNSVGRVGSVIELFRLHTNLPAEPEPYTKEEFLHLVEQAIDGMANLHFTDMLAAVQVTLENVKTNGGLVKLAKDRDKFLNKI